MNVNVFKVNKKDTEKTSSDFVLLPLLLTLITFEALISYAFQPAFTCLKSTMETPEQCVKAIQSY